MPPIMSSSRRSRFPRDLGARVDIAGGIDPADRIIDNPADALQDGDEVRIANR